MIYTNNFYKKAAKYVRLILNWCVCISVCKFSKTTKDKIYVRYIFRLKFIDYVLSHVVRLQIKEKRFVCLQFSTLTSLLNAICIFFAENKCISARTSLLLRHRYMTGMTRWTMHSLHDDTSYTDTSKTASD